MSRPVNPKRFFKKCEWCGETIRSRGHLMRKFCSRKCSGLAQRGKPGILPAARMRAAAERVKALPAKLCRQCGNAIKRKKQPSGRLDTAWHLARRKYCSHRCLWAAKVHEKPSRVAIYGRTRKINTSGQHCIRCGTMKNLCKHHDDYSKPMTIKIFCRRCHTKEHWARGDMGRRA